MTTFATPSLYKEQIDAAKSYLREQHLKKYDCLVSLPQCIEVGIDQEARSMIWRDLAQQEMTWSDFNRMVR